MAITLATPEVRDRLRRLDAFTAKGNRVIYLVDSSDPLRGAERDQPSIVRRLVDV